MSFNTWGSGSNQGYSTEQTIAAIRAADADIIGLQDTRAESVPCNTDYCPPRGPSILAELASALGYYSYEQDSSGVLMWASGILSRFPIMEATPHDLGVRIDVDGRVVYLFNIHGNDYPYGPYQLLDIPYGAAPFITSADEAVRYAWRKNGPDFQVLLQDTSVAEDADITIITGDFNEPSHRDWTEKAVAAGLHPLPVPWPLTSAIETEGFIDTYRAVHPDEVAKPGFTWSPLITPDTADDHADRIDFIFVRAQAAEVLQAQVLGENETMADIVISPWTSDHRAVLAEIKF